ncbi:hypothetical protein C3L23_01005 [Nautilia sp. PV-1]|uniref:hypothetical protein n=1 Tax=Nautilia sp. PV-1 TaxID=2579250 RepID=UPI000FD90031|nr:hypothetical protein [Nautilia sp. PV-1]AZV45894.1 hypothetical protein C3L23_01005 [Nautilia sp. PV-1]
MKINIQINDEFIDYLQNVDINDYVNNLIAKDIYIKSEKFKNDKAEFNKRLNSALKGNIIEHSQMWNKIDEL